ncbi:MAG: hypothetical protein WAM26_11140 [Nitrososphaeraceae archaeon]
MQRKSKQVIVTLPLSQLDRNECDYEFTELTPQVKHIREPENHVKYVSHLSS